MNRVSGWLLFVAALGMMAGLLAPDIRALHDWADLTTTTFVGNALAHFGVVVTAFIGGKLIPTYPANGLPGGSRSTDPPKRDLPKQ